MRIVKSVLTLLAIVLITGCAATGPRLSEISASIPPVPADKGRVYFFRGTTVLGAAITSDIRLNDRVVGVSQRSSFFYVDEAPGNCTVSTATEVERQLTFTLAAGETKYVRTSVSMGVLVGRVNSILESPNIAIAEIANLSYTGAPLKK
jgi:hypothetical protein